MTWRGWMGDVRGSRGKAALKSAGFFFVGPTTLLTRQFVAKNVT